MVYGVDECRRCGKPMKVASPKAWEHYEHARSRKPTMTPEQYRAAGWLAAPTPHQMMNSLDGVCYECKPLVVAKWRTNRPIALYCGIAIVAILLGVMTIANLFH